MFSANSSLSSLRSTLATYDDCSLVCLRDTKYCSEAMDVLYRRHEKAMLGYASRLYYRGGDAYRFDKALDRYDSKFIEDSLKSEVGFAFAKAYCKYSKDYRAENGKKASFYTCACFYIGVQLLGEKRANSILSDRCVAVDEEPAYDTGARKQPAGESGKKRPYRSVADLEKAYDAELLEDAVNDLALVRSFAKEGSREGEILDALLDAYDRGVRDYAADAAKEVGVSRQYVNKVLRGFRKRIRDEKQIEEIRGHYN